MKFLTIFTSAIKLISGILSLIADFFTKTKKTPTPKEVKEFKKEVEKEVENGDIDDINAKLKF